MAKIGFLGAGNMGECLIKGILSKSDENLCFYEINESRAEQIKRTYSIPELEQLKDLQTCDMIILAVKPQIFPAIIPELAGYLNHDTIIVSIAAGISLSYLSGFFPNSRIVRVMPNTPALLGEGMSVLSFSGLCSTTDKKRVLSLFESVGKTMILEESQMNAATAISGSGPAYFFLLAHFYASCNIGIDYQHALQLITQTMLGASRLLTETTQTPEELINKVASPGGTTVAALNVLKSSPLFDILSQSLSAAKQRAEELELKQ